MPPHNFSKLLNETRRFVNELLCFNNLMAAFVKKTKTSHNF